MKSINKIFTVLIAGALGFSSCSDFEEINYSPTAASSDQINVAYLINESITKAQQDPDVAERSFVLYWKVGGHQMLASGFSTGSYNDGWTTAYYNQSSAWQKSANLAVNLADEQIEKGLTGDEATLVPNLKQVARIWRAYLMSEFTDNFGPIPLNGFSGVNPEFSTEKDVYYYLLTELKESVAELNTSFVVPKEYEQYDRAYKFNFTKWAKFGNSLRMRLAMRLSEVDAAKAKSEFEDAVKGAILLAKDDIFTVAERPGWDALTGVMSREWNNQLLSASLNNMFLNLGGIETSRILKEDRYQSHIKPANYMGMKYERHYSSYTNDPSAGFFFDGLPNKIDPRAYQLFFIPGDHENPEYCKYPTWTNDWQTQKRDLINEDKETTLETIDAAYTWNAAPAGSYGDKGAKNRVHGYTGTNPGLVLKYRDSNSSRIFFANWETYFLIAEAGIRGWSVPMGAKEAYEAGVSSSFEYNGVSQFADEYLNSTEFNRVGTSVKWDHTAEPPATIEMEMVNGYTKAKEKYTYKYPVASNTLYGKALNDQLVKVITQKFLANTPWLPLETWSDHRRLGLPFFEHPCVEEPLVNMPKLTKSNYMKSSVAFYPQRIKYPASLKASNEEGYIQAEALLNGKDEVLTPLWWAKH